jgi:hypothetical protein
VQTTSASLVFCCLSFLTACQTQPQPSHLSARKVGDTVQLCLSNKETCPQEGGMSLDDISVYRYDSTFNNEIVWEASADSPIGNERIDGIITYGVPPKHWRNRRTPPALVCGKAYLVNPGAIFFGLKCDGNVEVFDFQYLEEFFRQNASPGPTKKDTANSSPGKS